MFRIAEYEDIEEISKLRIMQQILYFFRRYVCEKGKYFKNEKKVYKSFFKSLYIKIFDWLQNAFFKDSVEYMIKQTLKC